MKKFFQIFGLILFIVIILIFIAGFAGFVFLKTLDIKKYKPQILAAVSQSLGRPVDFKDIDLDVSLDQGIRLNLSGLTVGENPEFGNEPFVSIKEVNAGVDLMGFVVSRQISVPGVLIRSPQISIIRNSSGLFNIQTLGANTPKSSPENPQSGAALKGATPAALPVIFIKSFKIEDCRISFVDRSLSEELKLAVSKASVDVQNFSLNGPFDFASRAAVLSEDTNFTVTGKIRLDPANCAIHLSNADVSFNFKDLPLEKLKTLPGLTALPWPRVLDGEIQLKVREAAISSKGVENFHADLFLYGGRFAADEIIPGISVEARQMDLGIEDIVLDGSLPARVKFKAALYQDEVNADFKGKILFNPQKMEGRITDGEWTTDLALWPVKKIKAALTPLQNAPLPENLSGKLSLFIRQASFSKTGLADILADLKLQGATLSLENMIPGARVFLDKTDVGINNFSLGKQFTLSLKSAYLSPEQNIVFDGVVLVDPVSQSVQIKNGLTEINLNGFDLERFQAAGLVPANVPFPKTLGGVFQVGINDLSATPKGLGPMKMDFKWQNGKIALDNIAPGISVAADHINLKIKDFSLDKSFSAEGSLAYEDGDPNINFKATVALDLAGQTVAISDASIGADLEKLPLEQIKTQIASLKDVRFPDALKGKLVLDFKKLSAGPKGLGEFAADMALSEGEISVKELTPGVSLNVRQISAKIKDFSLDKPFDFELRLAYTSGEPDIDAAGKIGFSQADQTVSLKDAKVHVDLSKISLKDLKAGLAPLKDAPLPEQMKGDIDLTVANAVAGAAGLAALDSVVTLKDWQVKLKELNVPVGGKENIIKITENKILGENQNLDVGKGKITANFAVSDYLKTLDYNAGADIKGLDIAEILDQSQAQVKVEGLLSANIKIKGLGPDISNAAGDGTFEVTQVKLKDLNVLKMIVDKMSFIPNLQSDLQANMPEQYKGKLDEKDTAINKVSGTFALAGGNVTIEPFSTEADEFTLSGIVRAALDQTYAIDGNFKITAELSKIMGQSSRGLTYLYDPENLISMPVHITGKGAAVPQVNILKTAADLTKSAARNEGKRQLGKILDKALNVPGQEQGSDNSGSGDESPGSKIIGGILDKILK